MIHLSNELNEKLNDVTTLLATEYGIDQLPSKLDRFWELSFDEFSNALKLKKMPLQKKHELMEYFEKQKAKPASIADKIEKLQREIDEMVFDLYELTEEEKDIVRKTAS